MKNKTNRYFNVARTIKEIDDYIVKNTRISHQVTPFVRKDFYNFVTGQITCGCCGKKLGALRSMFHWHLYI